MLAISVNKSWFAQKMKSNAFQGPVGVAISQNIQPKYCSVAVDSFLTSPNDDTSHSLHKHIQFVSTSVCLYCN